MKKLLILILLVTLLTGNFSVVSYAAEKKWVDEYGNPNYTLEDIQNWEIQKGYYTRDELKLCEEKTKFYENSKKWQDYFSYMGLGAQEEYNLDTPQGRELYGYRHEQDMYSIEDIKYYQDEYDKFIKMGYSHKNADSFARFYAVGRLREEYIDKFGYDAVYKRIPVEVVFENRYGRKPTAKESEWLGRGLQRYAYIGGLLGRQVNASEIKTIDSGKEHLLIGITDKEYQEYEKFSRNRIGQGGNEFYTAYSKYISGIHVYGGEETTIYKLMLEYHNIDVLKELTEAERRALIYENGLYTSSYSIDSHYRVLQEHFKVGRFAPAKKHEYVRYTYDSDSNRNIKEIRVVDDYNYWTVVSSKTEYISKEEYSKGILSSKTEVVDEIRPYKYNGIIKVILTKNEFGETVGIRTQRTTQEEFFDYRKKINPLPKPPQELPTIKPIIKNNTIQNTNGIKVEVNGQSLQMDVKPVVENGRTLVPLRAIFEALEANIVWDGKTQTVTATKGDTTIVLQIGNKTAKINGSEVILDVPAKLVDGRTLVPARFVAEALGAKVEWDANTKTVLIQ